MENDKSIKKLAGKCGVNPQHLYDIRAGRKNPSDKLALALEKHTGIDFRVWKVGSAEERRSGLSALSDPGQKK